MAGFDRFGKVFALNGPVSPPTDQQADLGWDYIGAAPPTVQQFNAMFRNLDEKDNWLFGQIARVILSASLVPAASPDTLLLSALEALFPAEDLTYLYDSINQVITNAGLTPNNTTPRLWSAILTHFATKAELAAKVNRTGDTMPYLDISTWPSSANHATPKNYVDAVAAPKVNRSGDTMPYLALSDPPADGSRATNKNYVDGTNGLGTNGYKVWPGGLMEQWGLVGIAERPISSSLAVTFPTGFPNYCAGVFPVIETDNAGLMDMSAGVHNITQWGSDILIGTTLTEGVTSRWFGIRWRAIGW